MSRDGKKDFAELDTSTLPSLPKGWCWTTVGEIGDVQLGRQRSPKNRSDKYPTKYVRAANITWQGLRLDDVMDMDFRPSERATYTLQPGDILLSEASGSADEVGKPAIWHDEIPDCCFQNTVIRFRPRCLPPDFPFVVCCHFARNKLFAQVAKGVGIQHLGGDRFAQMPFPLPPAVEQVRIKAKVDELFSDLDAGVAALERVKANLKRYRVAVLKAAVEGRLTEQWRKRNRPKETGQQFLDRILRERRRKWEEEQLAAYSKAEKTPPAKWKEKYQEPAGVGANNRSQLPEGWCWATLDQVTECLDHLRVPVNKEERARRQGDVPYYGANGLVGCIDDYLFDEPLVLVVEDETFVGREKPFSYKITGKAWVNNHAHILRATGAVTTDFLNYSLMYYPFVPLTTGTTARRKLTKQRLLAASLALPPVNEQSEIVAEIDRRLSFVEQCNCVAAASLKRSSRLRQSILQRAFEGKLVPQDPADEPATTLLERIQRERNNGKTKPTRKTR